MPNCCTGTDFEKSPLFYISRRNTRQRDSKSTLTISMCYRISLSCISSANVKKEVTFQNLFLCGNWAFTLGTLTNTLFESFNVFKIIFKLSVMQI